MQDLLCSLARQVIGGKLGELPVNLMGKYGNLQPPEQSPPWVLALQVAQEAAEAALDNMNHMVQHMAFYVEGIAMLRTVSSSGCGVSVVGELELLDQHLMRVHGTATADAVLCFVAVHVAGCCGVEDLEHIEGPLDRFPLITDKLPHDLRQPAAQLCQVRTASGGSIQGARL